MKKLNYYYAEITDGSGSIRGKNEFRIDELNIIGENDINLCVDDLWFTTIRKQRDKYSTCLEVPRIHITTNDSIWGNRVTYSLYTFSTKRASTIRKEIQKEIERKFGFFLENKLDLGIIRDRN